MKRKGLNSLTSWGITLTCGLVHCLQTIPFRLAGLMYVEMMDYFNTSRTAASFSLFLSTVLRCFIGPLVGYCGKRFGVKEVTVAGCILSTVSVGACFFAKDMIGISLLLGLLYGVGIGCSCTLIPQILRNHFDKHLDKSIGCAMSCAYLGTIIFVPLAEYLFNEYGFAGTMLIMSGIILHSVPFSMLITSSAHSEGNPKSEKSDILSLKFLNKRNKDANHTCNIKLEIGSEKNNHRISNIITKDATKDEVMKTEKIVHEESKASKQTIRFCENFRIFFNIIFLVIMLTQSFHGFALMMVWTISIDFSRDKGFDRNKEVYLLISLSVAELIGRLGISWFSDKQYVTKRLFCVFSFLIMGLSCALMAWVNNFYAMVVSLMIFGISVNGLANTFPALIFEFMKKEEHIMALSSRLVLYGPMSLSSAPMIGYFRGTLGSYSWICYILCIGAIICSVLLLPLPHLAKRRK